MQQINTVHIMTCRLEITDLECITTSKKVQLSLYQAVDVYRVSMAVRLSVISAGRPLH